MTGQVLQLAILLLQLLPLQLQLALLAQVAHVAVPEDQRQQQAEAERGEAVGLVRQAQLRVGLGVVHRHLEGQHRQTVEGHRVGRADQDEHGAGETGQQQRRDVAGDALVDAGDGDAEAYDPCAAQQDQQAHAPQLGRLAAQPQREQADAAEEQGHGAMGVHDFLAPELMAEVRAEVLEGKHQDVDQVEGDGQQREVGQTREILQGDGKGQGRIHLDGVLDRFERRSGHVLRVRMGAVPSQHSSVATAALSGFPGRSSGLHGRTWRRFHSGSRLASSSATRPSRLQYAASGQGRSNGSRVDAPSPRPISR